MLASIAGLAVCPTFSKKLRSGGTRSDDSAASAVTGACERLTVTLKGPVDSLSDPICDTVPEGAGDSEKHTPPDLAEKLGISIGGLYERLNITTVGGEPRCIVQGSYSHLLRAQNGLVPSICR